MKRRDFLFLCLIHLLSLSAFCMDKDPEPEFKTIVSEMVSTCGRPGEDPSDCYDKFSRQFESHLLRTSVFDICERYGIRQSWQYQTDMQNIILSKTQNLFALKWKMDNPWTFRCSEQAINAYILRAKATKFDSPEEKRAASTLLDALMAERYSESASERD